MYLTYGSCSQFNCKPSWKRNFLSLLFRAGCLLCILGLLVVCIVMVLKIQNDLNQTFGAFINLISSNLLIMFCLIDFSIIRNSFPFMYLKRYSKILSLASHFRFISFCRVGTGLSDEELDTVVTKLKPYFR